MRMFFFDNRKQEYKHFVFEKSLQIVLDDDIKWIGECLNFNESKDESFIIDIFNMIKSSFEKNRWNNLYLAIKEISDFLSFTEEEEKFNLIMRGYIGEMCFIYYIMSSNHIKEEKRKDIANTIFNKFQIKAAQKYDFYISDYLKFEIKSTSNEDRKFLISYNQTQVSSREDILKYFFVKYSFVQEELGKNLSQIVDEIKCYLEIEDVLVPSHLLLSTTFRSWQEKFVFLDQIEVFMLDSNELPTIKNEKYIENINYQFNLEQYIKVNNIGRLDWINEFVTIMEDIINDE